MYLNKVLYCPICNLKFKEKVFRLSCMHSFCEKCIQTRKDDNCPLCGTSTSINNIIRNLFLEMILLMEKEFVYKANICDICDPMVETCEAEKYCKECSQYMCNKCLTKHNKIQSNIDHAVFIKNNIETTICKSYNQICEKHYQDLNIYCETISHYNHSNVCNIRQHSEESKQILLQRLDKIDRIILSQDKNNKNRFEYFDTFKRIHDYINFHINFKTYDRNEINDKKFSKLIDKLMRAKDNYLAKLNKISKEISDYTLSLNKQRIYLKNMIEFGSNTDLIKLIIDISKTDWSELKPPKQIQLEKLIYTKPLKDVKSLQTKELFGSIQTIQIYGMIDLAKNVSNLESICAMNHHLYILNYPNIHVYDMHLNNFKTSIDLEIKRVEYCAPRQIIGISNFLFILCDMINTYVKKSVIYKYNLNSYNHIDSEWKMIKLYRISSTNQATILATTGNKELIEFSLNGLQLKLIEYSVEADLAPTSCFGTSYQLVDGRYVATHQDEQLFHLYLIDSEGNFIKSNSIKCNGYASMCTDCDKYVFVSDYNRSIITLFSNELHKIREFYFAKVVKIFYDCENKRLLVKTLDEILYFNYDEESIKDISK